MEPRNRAKEAVLAKYEAIRQEQIKNGTYNPNRNGNLTWDGDYDNRNVIKAKPADENTLFDSEGFYVGSGDFY